MSLGWPATISVPSVSAPVLALAKLFGGAPLSCDLCVANTELTGSARRPPPVAGGCFSLPHSGTLRVVRTPPPLPPKPYLSVDGAF